MGLSPSGPMLFPEALAARAPRWAGAFPILWLPQHRPAALRWDLSEGPEAGSGCSPPSGAFSRRIGRVCGPVPHLSPLGGALARAANARSGPWDGSLPRLAALACARRMKTRALLLGRDKLARDLSRPATRPIQAGALYFRRNAEPSGPWARSFFPDATRIRIFPVVRDRSFLLKRLLPDPIISWKGR